MFETVECEENYAGSIKPDPEDQKTGRVSTDLFDSCSQFGVLPYLCGQLANAQPKECHKLDSERPDFIARYWGKAQPQLDQGPRWHPLAFHSLDVAACAVALLDDQPRLARALGRMLALDEVQARTWSLVAVALHDLGKFTPAFQVKSDEIAAQPDPVLKWSRPQPVDPGHAHTGGVLWDIALEDEVFASAMLDAKPRSFRRFYLAACGHHGRPAKETFAGDDQFWRAFDRDALDRDAPRNDALAFARAVLALLAPDGLPGAPTEAATKRASWLVAGIVNLCDWAGSDQAYFPYRCADEFASLSAYWKMTLEQAKTATQEKGLLASKAAASLNLSDLLALEANAPLRATPLQRWAQSDALAPLITAAAPVFAVIEDFTGSGKTEAAALLAHRIMAAGGDAGDGPRGLYWALPTQATSNAIHQRFKDKNVFRRFYVDDADPSIVNAHGGARIDQALAARARDNSQIAEANSYGGNGHDPAEAEETRWLHDDKRTALSADIGVGTIDQALLAVLPSKFNVMRLLGLSKSVLIIDEAHAYDPYMNALMDRLITFQAALGGSVIVLSATLTTAQRQALTAAFARGVGVLLKWPVDAGTHFPSALLATPGNSGGLRIHAEPLAADTIKQRGTRRDLPVELIESPELAEAYLIERAQAGECAVYIRNTVGDARASFERICAAVSSQALDLRVSLFHARFTMADRAEIERAVLSAFGKESKIEGRKGRILVATQVVEQSLDLDFDAMVTDLAPIDLLIQRAGRLHRHSGKGDPFRRQNRATPRLIIVGPAPVQDAKANWFSNVFPVAQYVYPNTGRLWAGLRQIEACGGLNLASENPRDLLDSVYEFPVEAMPKALQKLTLAYEEGTQQAQRGQGTSNALDLDGGYALGGQGQAWEDEAKTPTRLGEMGDPVRLAEIGKAGALVPFGWSSYTNRGSAPGWLDWSLAEIRLRRSQFAEFVPADEAERAAVQTLIAEWRSRRDETPVVVLRPRDQLKADNKRIAKIRILRASETLEAIAMYDRSVGWRLAGEG